MGLIYFQVENSEINLARINHKQSKRSNNSKIQNLNSKIKRLINICSSKKITDLLEMNRSNGQVLVETCIVLPVIILFIFLVMQVSIIFNTYMIVNYAAFSAARSAVSYFNSDSKGNAFSAAKNSARIILSTASIKSSVLSNIKVKKLGNDAYVKITYPMPYLINVKLFNYSFMTATCRMPIK